MKKGERIEAFVRGMGLPEDGAHDACYTGYFRCFNAGDYYEAHDVLEHLWLSTDGPDHAFYKGLIQLAGAFVHLKKQRARPWHPKDGMRMRPALRLFLLAENNLAPFAPRHLGLDVDAVLAICRDYRERIEEGGFAVNPWSPGAMPALSLR